LGNLSGISKRPPLGVAYCLAKLGQALVNLHLFSDSPTGLPFSARPPD